MNLNYEFHVFVPWFAFFIDLVLRLYFGYRILQRRLPVGVAWSWLGLVLLFPFIGTILYLYLGEYRLSARRQRRQEVATAVIRNLIHARFPLRSQVLDGVEPARTIEQMSWGLFQSPILEKNNIDLLKNAESAFPAMIRDIDAATISCDMEFYIWSDGGLADKFGEALMRAARRGVRVRVLVDQIGSLSFIKGANIKKLRDAGVIVQTALPSSLWRSLFSRPDLRIHRKILVIDNAIAYTGSLNLADPQFFKIDAGVGPWVDAACRVRGPAVEALGLVFLADWCIETGEDLQAELAKTKFKNSAENGEANIQCLPSGPAIKNSAIEQVLITSIYAAKSEVRMTTPYFIPSDAFLYALTSAANRGVKVTLIVPARVDSHLTQFASRTFLKDLHEAGVEVALFNGGLLHTKSVVIDGEVSLFGSLNLDPRSLRINFEITLAIYDKFFAQQIRDLQAFYLTGSTMFVAAPESRLVSLRGDLARLVSPLL